MDEQLYGIYLWVVWKGVVGNVGGVRRYIEGKEAGIAVLAGFMGAVMTCSKTMLYGSSPPPFSCDCISAVCTPKKQRGMTDET